MAERPETKGNAACETAGKLPRNDRTIIGAPRPAESFRLAKNLLSPVSGAKGFAGFRKTACLAAGQPPFFSGFRGNSRKRFPDAGVEGSHPEQPPETPARKSLPEGLFILSARFRKTQRSIARHNPQKDGRRQCKKDREPPFMQAAKPAGNRQLQYRNAVFPMISFTRETAFFIQKNRPIHAIFPPNPLHFTLVSSRQPACSGRLAISRSQEMENNSPKNGKVWFITGASRGFGLELTRLLLEKGHRVASTTRRLANLELAIGRENDRFLPLEVDLVNEDSVKNALTKTVEKFGGMDVIVNNAGYGQFGYVEEISDTLVRREFDVNVFGALNVIRNALPCLRRQRSGHIFNLSSMAGFTGFPGSGIYCASKFAIAGLSESLRDELADFGIRVTCVMPGNFRTDFLADSMQFEDGAIPDYAEKREAFHMLLKKMNRQQIGNPVRGAEIILSVSAMENPPLHLFLGPDAYKVATRQIKKIRADMDSIEPVAIDTNYPE